MPRKPRKPVRLDSTSDNSLEAFWPFLLTLMEQPQRGTMDEISDLQLGCTEAKLS